MLESSDRVAWTQHRNGGAGTGSGLQSFRDKQPDKRQPAVTGYFDKDYANIDDLIGSPK